MLFSTWLRILAFDEVVEPTTVSSDPLTGSSALREPIPALAAAVKLIAPAVISITAPAVADEAAPTAILFKPPCVLEPTLIRYVLEPAGDVDWNELLVTVICDPLVGPLLATCSAHLPLAESTFVKNPFHKLPLPLPPINSRLSSGLLPTVIFNVAFDSRELNTKLPLFIVSCVPVDAVFAPTCTVNAVVVPATVVSALPEPIVVVIPGAGLVELDAPKATLLIELPLSTCTKLDAIDEDASDVKLLCPTVKLE